MTPDPQPFRLPAQTRADLLMKSLRTIMQAGRWDYVERILSPEAAREHDVAGLVAVLAATFPAKRRLEETRARFYAIARKRVESNYPDEAAGLLDRLE